MKTADSVQSVEAAESSNAGGPKNGTPFAPVTERDEVLPFPQSSSASVEGGPGGDSQPVGPVEKCGHRLNFHARCEKVKGHRGKDGGPDAHTGMSPDEGSVVFCAPGCSLDELAADLRHFDASPAAEVERSLNRARVQCPAVPELLTRRQREAVQAVVLLLSEARKAVAERLGPAFFDELSESFRVQTIGGDLADLEAEVASLLGPAADRRKVRLSTAADVREQFDAAIAALEHFQGGFRRIANSRDTLRNAAACASELLEEGDHRGARKLLDTVLAEVAP